MKISKLRIKNLFGIKEIAFDTDKSRELVGNNGTGKTSVIDAIRYALNNKSTRDYIVRAGESEGEVIIETDTGVSITRKSRTNKADYKSIKDNGVDVTRPEFFLREIFTELQLNPVEFLTMPKNDQNRLILDLIDFKWDMEWIIEQFGETVPSVNYEQNILGVLYEIQADEGYYFCARQNINREARNKMAFIEEIGETLPQDYNADSWEKINLGDIHRKIQKIQDDNARIEKAKSYIDSRNNKVNSCRSKRDASIAEAKERTANKLHELDEEKHRAVTAFKEREKDIHANIIEWEKRISEAKNEVLLNKEQEKNLISKIASEKEITGKEEDSEITTITQGYEKETADVEAMVKVYEEVAGKEISPINDLQQEADTAERMKSFINEHRRMVAFQEDVEDLKAKSDEFTGKIEKARALPGIILETAKIPVKGLSIKDGIPLINGLPITNLSDGEKLELCIDVATSKDASLNIVLIDGVEKLSKGNRDVLYDKLRARGVQFVSTRTTDDKDLLVFEL